MFTIGDFARHGRVSVRMLRHYDAIGLLRPAQVDPATGYRSYAAAQLARLNRVIALKDSASPWSRCRTILDEKVARRSCAACCGCAGPSWRPRWPPDAARLAQVEARLRSIEREGHMPTDDVVIKRIPAVRVAELTATAASFEPEDIGPVIQPLYGELCHGWAGGGHPAGPASPTTRTHRTARARSASTRPCRSSRPTPDGHDFAIVDLPAVEPAATIVHHGSMDDVHADRPDPGPLDRRERLPVTGYPREIYLDCPENPDEWVTELQAPVTPA